MKKASGIFQYYVEGDDEKRLIEVLKTDMRLIIPGKVQILNVVQERLTDLKLRTLQDGTTLVFVFDTDVGVPTILNENIIKAKKSAQSLFLCDGSFLTYFLLLASMILRKKYSSSG